MDKKALVDSYIVHKSEVEDVLIYEPSIVLLNMIKEDDFNDLILSNPEHEHLLKSVYKRCKSNKQHIYTLRTLPIEISKDVACTILSDIHIAEFYKPLDDNTLELISAYMPLHLEEIIRSRLLPNIPPINDDDKRAISNIQNTAPIYSYFLFNNTKNQYFYKKVHEHVPGMMLLEAARQAAYDYVYSTTGHKYKEVSISMTSLGVNFLDYVVSSYPLEILFSQKDYVRRVKPKILEKKAWFYQKGKLKGTFSLNCAVIPMSIFPRLRNEHYAKTHNFYPFDKDMSIKVFSNNGQESNKKIIYLSLTGITIESDKDDNANISSVILLNKHEFSIKQHTTIETNSNWHYLIFDDLSKSQLLTLNNIINTSFYHKPMFDELNI
ncbi:hypothetical protein A9G48_08130 [Gilliamella sp. wkB18]|uniref:AfsA-related hotdog domain-containing protein n=1 Tax=Gilliamella sp. wkB18 TaxID=3120260 RepID=UPI0004DCBEF0|nr:AfsA-related hotdog domain-containing protein [Gilliamella apicola]KFA59209.1 hypothetical protein GAPWKB11_1098 [Gilliamella apicola]OCG62555.1 hypothetical protein A9G48_08130 [Gilliamella apicola]